jgi:hypothetical protein
MKRLLLLLVVSVLSQLTYRTAIHAQTLKKIKIGYPSLSFRQSNVWVGREYGLFNKYGLEVEPILFRGGQAVRRFKFSPGAGKRRFLQRDGEKIPDKIINPE